MKTLSDLPKISSFRMKEATNKPEAIISIIDVLKHNPLWLNKCTSAEFAIVYNMHTTQKRKSCLQLMSFQQVRDLFIEIKTEYYKQLDLQF